MDRLNVTIWIILSKYSYHSKQYNSNNLFHPSNKKMNTKWATGKAIASPPLTFVNQVLLNYSHAQSHAYCLGLFLQHRIVTTKATWPTKPKILSIYSFIEKVCSPLIQVIMVWLKDMVTSNKSISKGGDCGLLNRFLQTGRQLRGVHLISLTNILVKIIIMWSTHSNNLTRVFLPGLLILLLEQENRLLLSTYPQRGHTRKDEGKQYNHLSSAGACNKMEAAVCLPNAPIPAAEDFLPPCKTSWKQRIPNLSSRRHDFFFSGKCCCHWFFYFWKIIIGSVIIAIEFVCCWHIRHLLTKKVLCNKFLWSQIEGRRPSHWVLAILHTQNLKIFLQVKVLQVLSRVYEFCWNTKMRK